MAQIYVGNPALVDDEVLNAVKTLPDDFWVFAEFDCIRNVDWLIIKQLSDGKSALIVTELKRVSLPLRGGDNGPWERQASSAQWETITSTNSDDVNYFAQAVNTANALKRWLWLNHPRFLEQQHITPEIRADENRFRVWPNLLILSPPGVTHQLPIGPTSGYGRWYTRIDDWLSNLKSWNPPEVERRISLARAEVITLADHLSLRPMTPKVSSDAAASVASTVDETHPQAGKQAQEVQEPVAFLQWLEQLADRVSKMELRVQVLEDKPALLLSKEEREALKLSIDTLQRLLEPSRESPGREGVKTSPFLRVPADSRTGPLNQAEARALLTALKYDIIPNGKSRSLPSVLDAVNAQLPYRLQDTQYNGYGGAKTLFEQARADRLVQFGPLSGPNPTIYLSDEKIPAG
jgi:hypothetical protein